MRMSGRIGIFSDDAKTLVGGSSFDPHDVGWVSGKDDPLQERQVQSMLTGWCRIDLEHFAKRPSQVVQYVSCHDNYALWDRLVIQTGSSDMNAENSLALRRNKLAAGLVLLSAGIGFFQSGEEFCRSKNGNGNSYNGPARLNRLRWEQTWTRRDMVSWYRGMLTVRHAMFADLGKAAVEKMTFLDAQKGCVAFTMPCREGAPWKEVLVAFDPLEERVPLWLPGGRWQVLCDGSEHELWKRTPHHMSGEILLAPCAVMIFGR